MAARAWTLAGCVSAGGAVTGTAVGDGVAAFSFFFPTIELFIVVVAPATFFPEGALLPLPATVDAILDVAPLVAGVRTFGAVVGPPTGP